MTTLIAYYSLTGNTEKLAKHLAGKLNADVERIEGGNYSAKGFGIAIACFAALRQRAPAIQPPKKDASKYDLVILGSPIWAGHIAPPMRSYLQQLQGKVKRAAFLLSDEEGGAKIAFAELEKLSGCKPKAKVGVAAKDIKAGQWENACEAFARQLTA